MNRSMKSAGTAVERLTIKLVETEEEMEAAIAVRFRVFVAEQQVPAEEELDEFDATATHAIAIVNHQGQGQVVATGRVVYGNEDTAARIGRMAVDAQWRRKGIGGRILKFLEEQATTQGVDTYVLNAQEYVKDFYAAHGYVQQGGTFLEVDIPHVVMRKQAVS